MNEKYLSMTSFDWAQGQAAPRSDISAPHLETIMTLFMNKIL